jgi:hypothetical protein
MKRITYFLSVFLVLTAQLINAQNSDKITRVLDYKPAPGQHNTAVKAHSAITCAYTCMSI